MKRSIPLTGTTTSATLISPEHQRFIASLNRQIERTLASGKIKIRPHGQRQTISAEPMTDPAPVPVAKPLEPRRGPPPRPTFKRPSALQK